MPIDPADRPSWMPHPPRLPDWVMDRFPMEPGKPPESPDMTRGDWVMTLTALALVGIAVVLRQQPICVLFALAGMFLLGWQVARAFLAVVHEQQLTDWVNTRPDDRDVPFGERPNG